MEILNSYNSPEKKKPLHIIQLNSVSYAASHSPISRQIFDQAPSKIQKRLMLTDSGWCQMGTFFTPPDETLSMPELKYILKQMNKINIEAGRPKDSNLIIRTSEKAGMKKIFSEPAFIIENLGKENQYVKHLTRDGEINYQKSMDQVKKSWKMYHSDNESLQKTAIHGRLLVMGNELKLDIGSGIQHARALEKGDKTIVRIPISTAFSFYNLDSFVPDNLTILGNNISSDQINDFMNLNSSTGKQLGEFINWVSTNLGFHNYVAEFRNYTKNCKPSESFHIMDLDTTF